MKRYGGSREEHGSEKEGKNQCAGQATAHRRSVGAALPSAGGDGQPSPVALFFLTSDSLAYHP